MKTERGNAPRVAPNGEGGGLPCVFRFEEASREKLRLTTITAVKELENEANRVPQATLDLSSAFSRCPPN
jgi:hypothetical protein